MKEPRTLFVIPILNATRGIEPEMIPQTKEELAAILEKPISEQTVQIRDQLSYKPLKIMEWLNKTDIYNITLEPKELFEPYFVAHRSMQFYDEIFNSYGFNKLSQVYDMRNLGYNMVMLPDVFAIHIDHTSLNSTDWFKTYGKYSRYSLKVGAFVTRYKELPGMLTNTYEPPFIRSNNTFKDFKGFIEGCRASDLLTAARKNVRDMRRALFVGVVLLFAIVAYLAANMFLIFK